jgi:hypothetical protein
MDLSKLGLKPFKKDESNASTPTQSAVEPAPAPASAAKLESTPGVSAFKIKIGLPTVTAPSAPAPVGESTKEIDVFDLAKAGAPEPPVPTVIEVDEVEIESSPEGMRAKLDRLDRLIIAGSGVDQTSIDTARNYVQDIMIELKTHPEYSGVLVDKDVHNVMSFVRASMNLAQKTFTEVANKRTAKEMKPKKTNTKFDFTGLGDPSLEAPAVSKATKQLNQVANAGLDAFANLNVDSIVSKIKK